MSKSVLIMDTPSACIDCPCHFAWEIGAVVCGVKNKKLLADDIETFKPDWCPLKDIPEKRNAEDYLDDDADVFTAGYNACIEDILKERD